MNTGNAQGSDPRDTITLPADTAHGDTPAAEHQVRISRSEMVDISQDPIAEELAVTLKDILGRYIDRLYSSDHGGLSLEEETVVRHARGLLGRVGMIGDEHPPIR